MRGPNIKRDGNCGRRDGYNVVGWGNIPTEFLGINCSWTSWRPVGPNNETESDVMITNVDYDLYYYKPKNCVNRWELRGVMTHEFGHSFGLDHVSETKYRHMTMSPVLPKCSNRASSLGRGDYNALKKRYGA